MSEADPSDRSGRLLNDRDLAVIMRRAAKEGVTVERLAELVKMPVEDIRPKYEPLYESAKARAEIERRLPSEGLMQKLREHGAGL